MAIKSFHIVVLHRCVASSVYLYNMMLPPFFYIEVSKLANDLLEKWMAIFREGQTSMCVYVLMHMCVQH